MLSCYKIHNPNAIYANRINDIPPLISVDDDLTPSMI